MQRGTAAHEHPCTTFLRRRPPTESAPDESAIRKVYFKLANKYHPDKNPEGRDMFEKYLLLRGSAMVAAEFPHSRAISKAPAQTYTHRINKAYEFLVSTGKTMTAGPDPQRIILLLKAQVRSPTM